MNPAATSQRTSAVARALELPALWDASMYWPTVMPSLYSAKRSLAPRDFGLLVAIILITPSCGNALVARHFTTVSEAFLFAFGLRALGLGLGTSRSVGLGDQRGTRHRLRGFRLLLGCIFHHYITCFSCGHRPRRCNRTTTMPQRNRESKQENRGFATIFCERFSLIALSPCLAHILPTNDSIPKR